MNFFKRWNTIIEKNGKAKADKSFAGLVVIIKEVENGR